MATTRRKVGLDTRTLICELDPEETIGDRSRYLLETRLARPKEGVLILENILFGVSAMPGGGLTSRPSYLL